MKIKIENFIFNNENKKIFIFIFEKKELNFLMKNV
jgi:hypothetical protein